MPFPRRRLRDDSFPVAAGEGASFLRKPGTRPIYWSAARRKTLSFPKDSRRPARWTDRRSALRNAPPTSR